MQESPSNDKMLMLLAWVCFGILVAFAILVVDKREERECTGILQQAKTARDSIVTIKAHNHCLWFL